jgi:hypothetical protein
LTIIFGLRNLLVALLYGPAAHCKPKMMIWRRLVLRFCIRPIDGELLAIMDYPRGSVKRRRDPSWQVIVISHEASTGKSSNMKKSRTRAKLRLRI